MCGCLVDRELENCFAMNVSRVLLYNSNGTVLVSFPKDSAIQLRKKKKEEEGESLKTTGKCRIALRCAVVKSSSLIRNNPETTTEAQAFSPPCVKMVVNN